MKSLSCLITASFQMGKREKLELFMSLTYCWNCDVHGYFSITDSKYSGKIRGISYNIVITATYTHCKSRSEDLYKIIELKWKIFQIYVIKTQKAHLRKLAVFLLCYCICQHHSVSCGLAPARRRVLVFACYCTENAISPQTI